MILVEHLAIEFSSNTFYIANQDKITKGEILQIFLSISVSFDGSVEHNAIKSKAFNEKG